MKPMLTVDAAQNPANETARLEAVAALARAVSALAESIKPHPVVVQNCSFVNVTGKGKKR
jgi:hypothetical protein